MDDLMNKVVEKKGRRTVRVRLTPETIVPKTPEPLSVFPQGSISMEEKPKEVKPTTIIYNTTIQQVRGKRKTAPKKRKARKSKK